MRKLNVSTYKQMALGDLVVELDLVVRPAPPLLRLPTAAVSASAREISSAPSSLASCHAAPSSTRARRAEGS